MTVIEAERAKYEKVWQMPAYHEGKRPGVVHTPMFAEIANPDPGDSVIDLGCGAGTGGDSLRNLGLSVTYLDLVRVEGVGEPFIEQCLWHPLPSRNPPWKYGYCCDVMEHIPPEYSMLVLRNIMDACESVFFSISFREDMFGKLVGEPLHLTIRPYTWWRDRLAEFGELVEARDLLGEGVFYVRRR